MENELLKTLNDTVLHFSFKNTPVRGRIIRLKDVASESLKYNNLDNTTSKRLLDGMTLNVLIYNLFKSVGTLKLQISNHKDYELLASDMDSDSNVRAYIKPFKNSVYNSQESTKIMLTLDQGEDMEIYQSISEFSGDTFSNSVYNFFKNSEQLETISCFYSNAEKDDEKLSFGILLQKLSNYGHNELDKEKIEDDWNRLKILVKSITENEALDVHLYLSTLLWRLFNEDEIIIHKEEKINYKCRCSIEKAERAISLISNEEKQEIIKKDGKITVKCDFCGKEYNF